MDIFAHTLWAGAGVTLVSRRWPMAPRTLALTMVLAALPDVFHLLPIAGWWVFGDGSLAVLRAYAIAVPGQEPVLPRIVNLWSHHLHCVAHSAIVAGAVTLLLWVMRRSLWIPLLGWWSVFYPITQRGFDGLAWNTPWFMVLNYVSLSAAGWLLWQSRTNDLGECPRPLLDETQRGD